MRVLPRRSAQITAMSQRQLIATGNPRESDRVAVVSQHVAEGEVLEASPRRDRTLRIFFLIDSLGPGGAERSTALLSMELVARGHDVTVLTLYSVPDGSESEVVSAGVNHQQLIERGFIGQVREVRSIIATNRPDVLHTALFVSDQIGRLACLRTATSVVSSFVSMPRSLNRRNRSTIGYLKLLTVEAVDMMTGRFLVDRFHAVTPGVARLNRARKHLPPERVSIVERGRPVPDLSLRSDRRRNEIRAALGFGSDDQLILAAGRHEPQKAHVDLVRAVALASTRRAHVHLLIAGRDGHATEALRAEIQRHANAQAGFHVLGHRSDVDELLAAADVMALSSVVEGTAGIVLEAMGAGTPIVSTQLDGMEGILIDGHNSLTVPVGDATAMAAALGQVLDSPQLCADLTEAARDDFLERFTMGRSADNMVELYRSARRRI